MSLRYVRDRVVSFSFLFFFKATPTPDIYTLSLHDALPISPDEPAAKPPICGRRLMRGVAAGRSAQRACERSSDWRRGARRDRKSTRLNSSHQIISYAVFCLKKKNNKANENSRNSSILTSTK